MFKKKKRFSPLALLGLSISVCSIIISIFLAGEAQSFFDLKSLFITVGSTLGAFLFSFPFETIRNFFPVIKKAFTSSALNLEKDIDTLVTLSEVAKKQGLLNLERDLDRYTDDKFLKKGILNIIDNKDVDQLKEIMETEMYFMNRRHKKGRSMIEMIAATAPSLGLLGTYIGLIPMLINLDDPESLGPYMAIELVTSFYGAFIAFIIFSPMSKKLKALDDDEMIQKELLLKGLVGIKEGRNPRMLREELSNFVACSSMKMKKRLDKKSDSEGSETNKSFKKSA